MQARVQWMGNSLALRIPEALAREAGLGHDTPVELVFVEGKLVVTPVPAPRPKLAALLAGITADNLPGEVEVGTAVGAEAWAAGEGA
jgi:antitoxin MazE